MSQIPSAPALPPMLAVLGELDEVLGRLVGTDSWPLSDDDVGVALDLMAAAEARLAAVKLGVVGEADGRNLGVCAATSTAGWLRARLLMHPGAARRAVRLAGALRGECAASGRALAGGTISAGQAQTISEAVAGLPPVDVPTRARAEEFLIGQAAVLDPLLLAAAGRALAEALTTTPDSDERLARRHECRSLTRVVAADGMIRYLGWFDSEADATIFAALGPLAAPRPAAEGTKGPRTPAQRNADALVELSRIGLAAGGLPASGGAKPTVMVTMSLAALQQQIAGAALLPTGEVLSAAATRRLACDAKIIPVVLGGASQPLDIGRAARTVPAPMHAALVARDQACSFPGCDRLAAWSEAHHIRHWAEGGITALNNLVLVCLDHHNAVHHQGWTVSIEEDGLPTFRPPPWIDPQPKPRRHHRYTLRQLDYDIDGHDPPE